MLATVTADTEAFALIPGLPYYRAGDRGTIQSCAPIGGGAISDSWRNRKPFLRPDGYLYVGVRCGKKRCNRSVHSLVLEAHVGRRPHGFHGCHNNGNRQDNRLVNLRWDTPTANSRERHDHGTMPIGSTHGLAKLTESDVLEMRAMMASGVSTPAAGRRFGISTTTAGDIKRRRTWRHI